MALTANSSVHYFAGRQELTDLSASSVANSAVSLTTNVSTWTNSANAALAYFYLSATWNGTPTQNLTVDILGQRLNIVGTNDEKEPSINYPVTYIASFRTESTAKQSLGVFAQIPNGKDQQEWQFYLANRSGIALSKGWALHINPVAIGPS